MPSVADTIRRLHAAQYTPSLGSATIGQSRLRPLPASDSNPGALSGWCYVPQNDDRMALVVVLHGCTQTAAGYDCGAGWSDLAERYGFAVLFPEQRRENNPNLCFNWFNPNDTRRGHGEAESIRRMIETMLDRHPVDPTRIFITGLSAGGAMTSAMLAAYPEIFAGGGIIAGLPHGAATSVPEALERMRGQGHPRGTVYTDRVRAASDHAGPWPRISVWHGDADQTVNPINADHLIEQWRGLHGADAAPDRSELVGRHVRRVWLDEDGREAVEAYSLAGIGHGTPVHTYGADACGVAGPYMIEAGISSTRRLAASWELLGRARPASEPKTPARADAEMTPDPGEARTAGAMPGSSIQATIEDVLRSVGLFK